MATTLLKRFFSAASFWFLSGALLLLGAFALPSHLKLHYSSKEAHFESPIQASAKSITIRNDIYGKGAFAASRGGGKRSHKGLDLQAPVGTPVYAAKSGRIRYAGQGTGYGNYVEILHPDGLKTRYAHLSEFHVQSGQWIAQNELLGACGKTGNAGNPQMLPHVHFEIRSGNTPLDPLKNQLLNPLWEVV